jgi:hypothetical protein
MDPNTVKWEEEIIFNSLWEEEYVLWLFLLPILEGEGIM